MDTTTLIIIGIASIAAIRLLIGFTTISILENPLNAHQFYKYIDYAWGSFRENPIIGWDNSNTEDKQANQIGMFIGLSIDKLLHGKELKMRIWTRAFEKANGNDSTAFMIFSQICDRENIHILNRNNLWKKIIENRDGILASA